MCIKNKKIDAAEKLLILFKELIEELSHITCTLRLEELCGEFLIQTTSNTSLLIENKEKLKERLKKNDNSINTLKVNS